MSLKEKIATDTQAAMKSKSKDELNVLRMLKAKILEQEVHLRSSRGREYQLSDTETLEVISSYAKQRKQSIAAYREADRIDLAEREEAELEIISRYLPKQLSREEIEALVDRAITESGVESIKEIGRVMKMVMPMLKGAADGKLVNEIVRSKLN